MAYSLKLCFDIHSGNALAIGFVPKVKKHAVAKTPFQRYFVYGQAGLSSVHSGMIMIRSIKMCAAVRGQVKELNGPPKTLGQLFCSQTWEEILHLLGARRVIYIVYFRDHHRRIAWQVRLYADAEIY